MNIESDKEEHEEMSDVEEEQDLSAHFDEYNDDTILEGDSPLIKELQMLREMNKKLMSENAHLLKKVQWLEVLAMNNGSLKLTRKRKISPNQ